MDNNLFVLTAQNSVANHFLSELRDESIQKDRMRFRRNLERLGEILAYEISAKLHYAPARVKSPLGESSVEMLRQYPVLITILRAGLPLHQGLLNYFDRADSGFIGAWRTEDPQNLRVNVDYVSLPDVNEKPVILIDPMLATGQSVLSAYRQILSRGTPSHLFIVSVVAAPEGLRFLRERLTSSHSFWTCAVDEQLNSSFYIVPGLGDAGDLSYGVKE